MTVVKNTTNLTEAHDIIHDQQTELVHLRARCELLESKLRQLAPDLLPAEQARLPYRQFQARESVLGSHDQDATAVIRVASLATVSLLLVDIIRDPHGVVFDKLLALIVWGFRPLPLVAVFWAALFFTSLAVVPLFILWHSSQISSRMHLAGYVFTQLALWFVASTTTMAVRFPPSCAIILMAETARLSMKMHAFTVESGRYALEPPGTKRYQELHVELLNDSSALLRHYIYFLFAPTLIYRNRYPHTARTDWVRVAGYALHALIGIAVTGYIFCSSFLQEPSWDTWSSILVQILSSMIPGMALMLLTFFIILHSWLNAFAEILKFADRQFYLRWWTARSYASYYRQWNKVVSDWIHAYIYSDLQRLGYGSEFAAVISILVSAVVHEYIVTLTLGFFYPVMFVLFAGFGMFFMFMTGVVRKHSDIWNWFLWSTLFFGNGILLSLYSAEYMARTEHVVQQYPINKTSWVPYSWQIFRSRS